MEIKDLYFSYGSNTVLRGVNAKIPSGGITTLMGANGCGKSTLLRLMTKGLTPERGGVYLDGKSIAKIRPRIFAKHTAVVHQYNTAPGDITVGRLVSYGRTPYLGLSGSMTSEDKEIVDWALSVTNTKKYVQTPIGTLSGGQKQRVWLAMALVQKTEYLFLDEPTTFLDVRYQIQILNLIKSLNREYKITVVMVLHDINQAAYYSDRIIGLRDGETAFTGTPDRLTDEVIHSLFGIGLKTINEGDMRHILTVPQNKS